MVTDERYKAVLFVGAPGSGKGTQAALLAQTGRYFHFSTGEMFRSLDTSTDLGKYVRSRIDNGKYVDDATTIALFQQEIRRLVKERKFKPREQRILLDGIPRTVPQVGLVREIADVEQVIYLNTSDEVCVQRMKTRAARPEDIDGQKIIKRLEIFHKDTKPLISGYDQNIVTIIDASQSRETIHREVMSRIKTNLSKKNLESSTS